MNKTAESKRAYVNNNQVHLDKDNINSILYDI